MLQSIVLHDNIKIIFSFFIIGQLSFPERPGNPTEGKGSVQLTFSVKMVPFVKNNFSTKSSY
jgi:hypothetical protein